MARCLLPSLVRRSKNRLDNVFDLFTPDSIRTLAKLLRTEPRRSPRPSFDADRLSWETQKWHRRGIRRGRPLTHAHSSSATRLRSPPLECLPLASRCRSDAEAAEIAMAGFTLFRPNLACNSRHVFFRHEDHTASLQQPQTDFLPRSKNRVERNLVDNPPGIARIHPEHSR